MVSHDVDQIAECLLLLSETDSSIMSLIFMQKLDRSGKFGTSSFSILHITTWLLDMTMSLFLCTTELNTLLTKWASNLLPEIIYFLWATHSPNTSKKHNLSSHDQWSRSSFLINENSSTYQVSQQMALQYITLRRSRFQFTDLKKVGILSGNEHPSRHLTITLWKQE